MRVLDEYGTSELWKAIKSYVGGSGGVVHWEDILGRPDLSNVSSMNVFVVILRSDLWSDNQQTVAIDGISADETQQLIIPVPQRVNEDSYSNAGIICVEQGENFLVFRADNAPDEDLYVNIFVFGAAEVKEESPGTFEWWSPKMTSNNTPAPFVVTATSESGGQSVLYGAFDGVSVGKQETPSGNFIGGIWESTKGGGYVQIDFGSQMYLFNGFKVNIPYRSSGVIGAPNRMKILGSNNGNDWDTIGDYKNIQWHSVGEYTEFMLDKNVNYRYYRFGAEDLTTSDMPSSAYLYFTIGDIQFSKLEDSQ